MQGGMESQEAGENQVSQDHQEELASPDQQDQKESVDKVGMLEKEVYLEHLVQKVLYCLTFNGDSSSTIIILFYNFLKLNYNKPSFLRSTRETRSNWPIRYPRTQWSSWRNGHYRPNRAIRSYWTKRPERYQR